MAKWIWAVKGGSRNAETTAYTYDAANNRLSKVVTGGSNAGTTGYTYNALNQLTQYSDSQQAVALSYDANGNRATRTVTGGTASGVDTYGYDYENRLVTLAKGAGAVSGTYEYVYDYRTRRVVRDETAAGGVSTNVVFSGGLSVQEYAAGSTYASVEYIRGSDYGGGVGGILYTLRGGDASFTHENRRGDVIAKTNASGVLTYQASYEAYGTRTQENGSTQDRQKANTKDEDPTGLLNEGFRYRDLETGNFIVADMLGRVPVNSPGNDTPGSPGTYNIIMPKEKWFVDGKSVSEREYNEALELGVPQAGNGPTKTAKDSGQEADYHVAVQSGETGTPGQKSHYHTAAAGFPNLYTYVNQNPWTFFDPEGLEVTINLVNPNDKQVYEGAQKYLARPNEVSVAAHGKPGAMVDANGKPISVQELADKIKNAPGYSPNATITLIACHSGASYREGDAFVSEAKGDPMARQLSAILKTNTVKGASNYTHFQPITGNPDKTDAYTGPKVKDSSPCRPDPKAPGPRTWNYYKNGQQVGSSSS